MAYVPNSTMTEYRSGKNMSNDQFAYTYAYSRNATQESFNTHKHISMELLFE